MPDRSFHLRFGGLAVSGQDAFYFPHRQFNALHATLSGCHQYDTADLPKCDTRFGVSVKRKDIFNDNEVGLFGIQNGAEFRKNMIQSAGQDLGLGGSNRAEAILAYSGAGSLHDPETGISQTRIYAYDLEWRFQGSYFVFVYH